MKSEESCPLSPPPTTEKRHNSSTAVANSSFFTLNYNYQRKVNVFFISRSIVFPEIGAFFRKK